MSPCQAVQGDRYDGRFLQSFKCNTHAIAAEKRAAFNAHCRSVTATELLKDCPPSRPPSAPSTTSRPRLGVARRPASVAKTHETKEPLSTKGLCDSLLSDLFPGVGNSASAGRGACITSKLSPQTWQTQTWTENGEVGKVHALGGRAVQHRPATAPPARGAVQVAARAATPAVVWPPWAITGENSATGARFPGNSRSRQRRPQTAPSTHVPGQDYGQQGKRGRAPWAVVSECGEESIETHARSRPQSAPLRVVAPHKPSCESRGRKDNGPCGEQRRRSSSTPAARSSKRLVVTSETIRQIAKEAVLEALGQLSASE